MKEILVDTNVLVSFLTDRNQEQQQKAAAMFQAAAEQKQLLVLHTIPISETIHVLLNLYDLSAQVVSTILLGLLALPGVISEEELNWNLVLELWPDEIPSFGDAVVASLATSGPYAAVATFDRGLRKKLARLGSSSYWPD